MTLKITLLMSYENSNNFICLGKTSPSATHLCSMFPSYRKRSLNLQNKTIDWFLYDENINLEYFKGNKHEESYPGNNFHFMQQLQKSWNLAVIDATRDFSFALMVLLLHCLCLDQPAAWSTMLIEWFVCIQNVALGRKGLKSLF